MLGSIMRRYHNRQSVQAYKPGYGGRTTGLSGTLRQIVSPQVLEVSGGLDSDNPSVVAR